MNFNPVIRRRLALASAFTAAIIATGYAASEHDRAQSLSCRAHSLEDMIIAQKEGASVSAEETPLPKIRQAARDFIQEKKPGAKVEGVFTLALGRDSGLYIAGADTAIDGQRQTIDLLVRLYTRKGGGTYYRAEGLGSERAAAMLEQARDASDISETDIARPSAVSSD